MLGLRHYLGTAIDLFQGDITSFVCDAMVTSAHSSLTGGVGVDGAIHRVGGPEILRACQSIGSCNPGEAVVSMAGQLPASKLIHAVGPIWQGGRNGEASLLRAAITQSLCRAAELKLRHIALPSISTGLGKFPLTEASSIAMLAVREFCQEHTAKLRRISFVLFDAETYKAYQAALFVSFPETEGTDA